MSETQSFVFDISSKHYLSDKIWHKDMTFQLHAKFESMLVASKNVEIKSLQLYLLYLLDKIWNHLSVVNRDAETDTCFDSKDVQIKTWLLSKDAKIKTWFCHLLNVSMEVDIKTWIVRQNLEAILRHRRKMVDA